MNYCQRIEDCFSDRLNQHGITRAEHEAALTQLVTAFDTLKARRIEPANALLDIAAHTGDLAGIERLATDIRQRFRHVVVAGTGGSGLSGRTLVGLMPITVNPAFHFLDNIDPDTMEAVLERIDIKESCFLIISRSGTTAETLSQFYALVHHVGKTFGEKAIGERFFVISLPEDNPLRHSAGGWGMTLLDHHQQIGGRFSVLTNVGLLPAAIAGLDIRALRKGAATVARQMDEVIAPADCAPAAGAALQYAYIRKNYPITVMLPYAERLACFSAWYRQSWAESLGKQGRGSTPIRALGTTDQHSQLQLYLDGPKDKLFTMITLERAGQGPVIAAPDIPELAYLKGKTLGDVMAAEQKATFETLVAHGCPVRLFTLTSLGEEQMGALLMHFMLEIILTSFLLDVNPFDQPAVEEGKKRARKALLKGDL